MTPLATKAFSEAKMERWEKKHTTPRMRARIASKRFNKADRKAAKNLCKNFK